MLCQSFLLRITTEKQKCTTTSSKALPVTPALAACHKYRKKKVLFSGEQH